MDLIKNQLEVSYLQDQQVLEKQKLQKNYQLNWEYILKDLI